MYTIFGLPFNAPSRGVLCQTNFLWLSNINAAQLYSGVDFLCHFKRPKALGLQPLQRLVQV